MFEILLVKDRFANWLFTSRCDWWGNFARFLRLVWKSLLYNSLTLLYDYQEASWKVFPSRTWKRLKYIKPWKAWALSWHTVMPYIQLTSHMNKPKIWGKTAISSTDKTMWQCGHRKWWRAEAFIRSLYPRPNHPSAFKTCVCHFTGSSSEKTVDSWM